MFKSSATFSSKNKKGHKKWPAYQKRGFLLLKSPNGNAGCILSRLTAYGKKKSDLVTPLKINLGMF